MAVERGRATALRAPSMELTPVNIAIAMGGGVTLVGYVAYILLPAWGSYERLWERIAAGFMTLFILVSLLGLGLTLGLSIVYFYDVYV